MSEKLPSVWLAIMPLNEDFTGEPGVQWAFQQMDAISLTETNECDVPYVPASRLREAEERITSLMDKYSEAASGYLEVAKKLAAAEERVSALEQRITFILDDPECELYRNQAADEIGYTASFPGKHSAPKAVTPEIPGQ